MADPQVAELTVDEFADNTKRVLTSEGVGGPDTQAFRAAFAGIQKDYPDGLSREGSVREMLKRLPPEVSAKFSVKGLGAGPPFVSGVLGPPGTGAAGPPPPDPRGFLTKPLVDYVPGLRSGVMAAARSLAEPGLPPVPESYESQVASGVSRPVARIRTFLTSGPETKQEEAKLRQKRAGPDLQREQGFMQGLAESGLDMTSPANLATMGALYASGLPALRPLLGKFPRLAALGPMIKTGLGGWFTASTVKNLSQEVPAIKAAEDAGDPEAAGRATAKAFVSLIFLPGAAHMAASGATRMASGAASGSGDFLRSESTGPRPSSPGGPTPVATGGPPPPVSPPPTGLGAPPPGGPGGSGGSGGPGGPSAPPPAPPPGPIAIRNPVEAPNAPYLAGAQSAVTVGGKPRSVFEPTRPAPDIESMKMTAEQIERRIGNLTEEQAQANAPVPGAIQSQESAAREQEIRRLEARLRQINSDAAAAEKARVEAEQQAAAQRAAEEQARAAAAQAAAARRAVPRLAPEAGAATPKATAADWLGRAKEIVTNTAGAPEIKIRMKDAAGTDFGARTFPAGTSAMEIASALAREPNLADIDVAGVQPGVQIPTPLEVAQQAYESAKLTTDDAALSAQAEALALKYPSAAGKVRAAFKMGVQKARAEASRPAAAPPTPVGAPPAEAAQPSTAQPGGRLLDQIIGAQPTAEAAPLAGRAGALLPYAQNIVEDFRARGITSGEIEIQPKDEAGNPFGQKLRFPVGTDPTLIAKALADVPGLRGVDYRRAAPTPRTAAAPSGLLGDIIAAQSGQPGNRPPLSPSGTTPPSAAPAAPAATQPSLLDQAMAATSERPPAPPPGPAAAPAPPAETPPVTSPPAAQPSAPPPPPASEPWRYLSALEPEAIFQAVKPPAKKQPAQAFTDFVTKAQDAFFKKAAEIPKEALTPDMKQRMAESYQRLLDKLEAYKKTAASRAAKEAPAAAPPAPPPTPVETPASTAPAGPEVEPTPEMYQIAGKVATDAQQRVGLSAVQITLQDAAGKPLGEPVIIPTSALLMNLPDLIAGTPGVARVVSEPPPGATRSRFKNTSILQGQPPAPPPGPVR